MAKRKHKINNGNGGYAWTTRPVSKMNNKELSILGRYTRKFGKRYTSKKRRTYLKSENV